VGIFPVSAESAFTASDECIKLLKLEEGFSVTPYWDYAQYTVGYGTCCPSDMVEYYMETGEISIENEMIEQLVSNYIKNQKDLIDLKTITSIQTGWDEYYDLISLANSDEIVSKKIPMECSHVVNGYSDKTLCKYNYETGFEILVNYLNVDLSQIDSEYKSYHIGQENFELPTTGLKKEGYTFGGWYYTSECTEGTEVTSIDTSRTSSKNKTQLYAKWITDTPEA
jgi:uncharacterized repeat protein (TIGR02543 family)